MEIPVRKILGLFYPDVFSRKNKKKSSTRLNKKRFLLIILGAFVLMHLLLLLIYYNSFLSMQYDVEEAEAQIDTHLQRRKNIILNLTTMVTEYAKHEKEVFKYTSDTRKEMLKLDAMLEKILKNLKDKSVPGGKGGIDSLLAKIFAIAEQYPDLRLSENFLSFMDALVDCENKIAEQRMVYNERANDMSTAVGQFPGYIFACLYGFESPRFFKPEEIARKPPDVKY